MSGLIHRPRNRSRSIYDRQVWMTFAGIFINTIGGRIVMQFMWIVVGVVFTVSVAGLGMTADNV
jgi:hypothetical protein